MSGNIFELSQSCAFASSNNDLGFQTLLKSCSEQGVFYYKENFNALVKDINTSLNSSFNKEKGLSLLLVCLPQITIEAYSSNAVSWMTHCIKIINNKTNLEGLALNVLGQLIRSSSNFPEIFKEAAKHIIPKFLQDNVKREKCPEVSVPFLDCLKVCIQEYSGPSIEFKNDLARLLSSGRVVEGRRELVQAAARCVSLLPQLGGGGRQGGTHKTTWHQQQLSLVSLLHSLLNNILYHLIHCATEEETSQDQLIKLEEVKDKDILVKTQRLAAQFSSVCLFLQSMLLEEFPTSKQVAPDAILDVIAHAQQPTQMTLSTSREELAVLAVLPTIQVAVLRLLEALVLSLGRNLIPQGGLINFFCSQAVVWTNKQREDWPYAMDKPFRHTRLAAYCCLYSWLSVTGAANQVDVLLDKPLTIMLADINAEKPTVKLKVGSKQSKGKKQQMLVGLEERSDKLGDSLANHRLCERALLTIDQLLRAAPVLFKPNTYTSVCQTVLSVLDELPVPYSKVSCLCALYQLLFTLCSEPPSSAAPPYAAALSAFRAGSHHSSTQVKTTCLSAISFLEKVIHPVASTLYFPLSQETRITSEDFQSQDIQQKDDSEPEMKRRKLDSESNDSFILELSEDGIKSAEEVCIPEANSNLSQSNDLGENTTADSSEKQHFEVLSPGCEDNIEAEVIHTSADIERNIEVHRVSKKVSVEFDENLLENQEIHMKSNAAPILEENERNTEVQEMKFEDKLHSEMNESQKEAEELDEDVSQMLNDFKDEIN